MLSFQVRRSRRTSHLPLQSPLTGPTPCYRVNRLRRGVFVEESRGGWVPPSAKMPFATSEHGSDPTSPNNDFEGHSRRSTSSVSLPHIFPHSRQTCPQRAHAATTPSLRVARRSSDLRSYCRWVRLSMQAKSLLGGEPAHGTATHFPSEGTMPHSHRHRRVQLTQNVQLDLTKPL